MPELSAAGGGVVGDALVVHPDGVLHLGGKVRLKIEVQAVGPGAERVQHGQGGLGGPLHLPAGDLLPPVQHGTDPLLHGGVVVRKPFVLDVGGHQLQDGDAGLHRRVADLDLLGLVHADQVADVHGPAVPDRALLGRKPLAHRRHHDGGQKQQ